IDKSESYLAAPEHRECYDRLIKSYDIEKTLFSIYDKVYSLKKSQKYKDKDKDEGPFAGSDQRLKKRNTSKDAKPKKAIHDVCREVYRSAHQFIKGSVASVVGGGVGVDCGGGRVKDGIDCGMTVEYIVKLNLGEMMKMIAIMDKKSRSEGSDEENDSDDDNTQSDSEKGSDSEHETDENESNYNDSDDETKNSNKVEGDEEEEMDHITSQLYDEVDIRLNEPVDDDEGLIQNEGTNDEMINVQRCCQRETLEMPLSKKKEKMTVKKRKRIDLLSKVALLKEAQFEEVRKKSLRDFHKTHPSGSGTVTKTTQSAAKIKPFVTNEGTGLKPWVPDIENRAYKNQEKLYYPRFTKVIIYYLLTQNKTVSWRNKIGVHTSKDDYLINTLRFFTIKEATQIYGPILPESLTSPEMKETIAYKTYLVFATGATPPKKARKFKKPASPQLTTVSVSPEEPTKKLKRVKRSVKKSSKAPAGGVVKEKLLRCHCLRRRKR
nr:hypothetical protein [Tanacetum cinerariifolium]